jgi:hypothetical protein
MHRVALMDPTIGPPQCLICNRGNTADEPDSMAEFWAMDLERDINWGDPAYICKYCCERLAVEVGFVPLEQVQGLEATIRQKNQDIHRLEAERDSLRRRFRSTKLGRKALKSTQAQSTGQTM